MTPVSYLKIRVSLIEVVIPVSRFSKQILTTEYRSDTIKLADNDLLLSQLLLLPPSRRRYSVAERTKLNSSVTFQLPKSRARKLQAKGTDIGCLLYEIHMDMMCRYVWAQIQSGTENWEALENFYVDYRIEEEDFRMRSAWRRIKRKAEALGKLNQYNLRAYYTKQQEDEKRQELRSRRPLVCIPPLSEQEAIEARNKFFRDFYHSETKTSDSIVKCFRVWLDYYFCAYTIEEICAKWELSEEEALKQMRQFKAALHRDNAFYEIVYNCMRSFYEKDCLKVLPMS